MKLYAHPFSSYSQKVLIALYENDVPFDYLNLEAATVKDELASLWPLKRFPVLVDQGRTLIESSTIIEYLQCASSLRNSGKLDEAHAQRRLAEAGACGALSRCRNTAGDGVPCLCCPCRVHS